jgi:hypothetical protein
MVFLVNEEKQRGTERNSPTTGHFMTNTPTALENF